MGRPAVFLDRDGVLNCVLLRQGRPFPPPSLEELRIAPGAPEALGRLRAAGFALVCVTNQPDVARGQQRREVVDAINAAIRRQLPLDDLRVCYHDGSDDCGCRKPRPGMLTASALEHGLDFAASVMIGDRWSDIEAGRRAGCRRTILIGDAYNEPNQWNVRPDACVTTLAEAAAWILGRSEQ